MKIFGIGRCLSFLAGWTICGAGLWHSLAAAETAPPDSPSRQVKPVTFAVADKRFRALAVSPDALNLHWKNDDGQAYGSMIRLKKSLSTQGQTVLAMMNAGIYSDDDTPAGLHIEQGKRLKQLNTKQGHGNFHLQPNGVFLVTQSGHADTVTTADYQRRYADKADTLTLATQSGPMLLIDGKINPKFLPDSQSEYTRNGICTTADGQVFWFATDSFPAETSNLYHFALAAQQLGCDNALYLDGSISKLYINGEDAIFHLAHYVGILSITSP